jgi:phosphatidylglycerophosphatase A
VWRRAGRDTAGRDGHDITPQTGVINIFRRHRDRSPKQVPAEFVPPSVWRNPWHFLAFGFGSGTLPKAPGTWGSLVALPFIPLWQMLPDWGYWLMLGITMLFGFWLCGKVADDLRVHDHEGIVWDEMVGMWITLWLVPEGWQWLLAGFLMFRFFDILKPWPIRWIDRHVHGGVGIMLDDVLAGVFAWLACRGWCGFSPDRIEGEETKDGSLLAGACCLAPCASAQLRRRRGHPSGQRGLGGLHRRRRPWAGLGRAAQVFEPAGVKLDIRTEPYRAPSAWPSAAVDACVGSYRDEASDLLYPRWNFDTDHIYALGLAATRADPGDPGQLSAGVGSWLRLPGLLAQCAHYAESAAYRHRVDADPRPRRLYIDALTEVDYVVSRPRIHRSCADPHRRTAAVPVLCRPRRRDADGAVRQRMEQLVKSGELKPRSWKQPYPFER